MEQQNYASRRMEDAHKEDIFRKSESYGSLKIDYDALAVEGDGSKKCGCFPSWFPRELRKVFDLAWSMIVVTLFSNLMAPIAIAFVGNTLGPKELGGVALANTVINVTGMCIGIGLSTACDTLFSQAYGSPNKMKVGVYLQRGCLVISLYLFPCWAIHLNAESILVAAGQDPVIAKIAGDYILYFMPGLLFVFLNQVFLKYLRNQNILYPTIWTGALGIGVNSLMHYLLLNVADLGIMGSALSQVLGFFTMFGSVLAYTIIISKFKTNDRTWGGWSVEAFQDWGSLNKLAVSGMLQVSLQWWGFEIGTLLSGLLGDVQLAAQSVLFQITTIVFMVPIGIGIGCNIRVGHLLGANNAVQARRAAKVGLFSYWTCGLVIALLLLALKDYIPRVFSSDSQILETASSYMPILALYSFFDGTSGTSSGILRGAGRQIVAAFIIFLGMYTVGLPVGIPLMFLTGLQTAGFWWGAVMGKAVENVIYLATVLRTDWEKEAEKAQIRAGMMDFFYQEDMMTSSTSEVETDLDTDDEATGLISTENKRGRRRTLSSRTAPKKRQPKYCGQYISSQVDVKATTDNEDKLTTNELICRRGLTVLGALMVLAIGVFSRFSFVALAPVSPAWAALCVPFGNASVVNNTVVIGNVTYSICS